MAINKIQDDLCEAIEYIVNNAVENASYDKTIQASIISCIDATIGKYKVKYQDSSFYAYSQTTETTYLSGDDVYVLVPGNDMSRDKTILGTVKKLGVNYTATPEGEEAYRVIGKNCIEGNNNYELCSYSSNMVQTVYEKNKKNEINLNTKAVETYLHRSESVLCGATFRTSLPVEQQFRGNYGIVFELNFLDNGTEQIVTKNYVVDVNQMTGNPYKITHDRREYGIFDIDTANFIDINRIYLFVSDFPNRAANKPADIFIKNLELVGQSKLTEEELKSQSLEFHSTKGFIFDDKDLDSDIREVEAVVKVKGKVVDKNSQSLKYYWFKENIGITTKSEKYNKYGGPGWECLNEGMVVKAGDDFTAPVIEWAPGKPQISITKASSAAKENTYKCVVLFGEVILSEEFIITNLTSQYDITIDSDAGTKFYFDIGTPTLTCKINGIEKNDSNFTYIWASIDNNNQFVSLPETTADNDIYNAAAAAYETLSSQVQNETAMPAASKDKLNEYLTTMENYDKIMRVEKNKLIKVQIKDISNFNTYKCAVYYNGVYVGGASIVLTNSLESEGIYTLIINNGSQVFKYDENGISPTSRTSENPYVIPPLSFTVYDNLGNELQKDVLESKDCKVKWIVPKDNTMIQISNNYTPDPGTTNIYSKEKLFNIVYNISEKYYVSKQNNNIQLEVDYKDLHLTAQTNFTFAKEGDPGTNGTDFLCRIVPNCATGSAPTYPMLSNGVLNYTPVQTGKWFNVQLWHSGELIYNKSVSGNSEEGKPVTVNWSVLANKYNNQISDNTDITVNATKGVFSYKGYTNNSSPANIIKCTVNYDGMIYYATLPLITAKISNSNYRVALKDHTGFRFATYSADGRRASYDNANPFELFLEQKINNVWEDISHSEKYECTYEWNRRGKIYNTVDKKWELSINLDFKERDEVDTSNDPATGIGNPIHIKPADEYKNECVNNGLECIIRRGSSEVARIHIPIHLMLNRYGQSALNDWDGNSINIDKEGGFILAPQIGAGKKDTENRFTGLLMGQVKEANQKRADIGLIGYHRGERTIHIDSEGGYAIFGKNGPGQIILDPMSGKGMIYSNNFWAGYYDDNTDTTKNGLPKTNYSYSNNKYNGQKNQNNSNTQEDTDSGMLIDLTTPRILWGNGNFRVDPNGFIYAKGGGEIAGWKIDSYKIHSADGSSRTTLGKTGMSSVYNDNGEGVTLKPFKLVNSNGDGYATSNKAAAFWAGTDKFIVAHDGYLKCESATIGSGTKPIFITKSSADGNQSAIYSGKKSAFNSSNNGFYIGTDGIALGSHNSNGESKFQVTSSGVMYSREGTIGGWTIDRDEIRAGRNNGGIVLKANGSMEGGTGGETWSITQSGTATFNKIIASSSGTIGGWKIDGNKLIGGNVTINSNGDISCSGGNGWYIKNNGSARFGNLSVDTNGNITANGGNFNNVSVSGAITATSGRFDNCTIGDSCTIGGQRVDGAFVKNANIASGAITTGKIADAAITNAKIADATITSAKIKNLTADKIVGGTIDGEVLSGVDASFGRLGCSEFNAMTVAADIISVNNVYGSFQIGSEIGQDLSQWFMTGWGNTNTSGGIFEPGKLVVGITFKGKNLKFTKGILTSVGGETSATLTLKI